MFESTLSKIVQEKRIDWFSIRHAKVLQCLQKHKSLYVGDLLHITCIEKKYIHALLKELSEKKLVQFNEDKYTILDENECAINILKEAEKETAMVKAR